MLPCAFLLLISALCLSARALRAGRKSRSSPISSFCSYTRRGHGPYEPSLITSQDTKGLSESERVVIERESNAGRLVKHGYGITLTAASAVSTAFLKAS